MSRRPKPVIGPRRVRLAWYPLALLPILLLIAAPLAGWVPLLVLPFALFLLFFWLFSLGFAIYGKLRTIKEPRQ